MLPGYEQNADNVWQKTGQEDQLPAWITTVAMKDLSTDGKSAAVRAALVADLKYDENPIPVTPQHLKITKKEFTGDDNTTSHEWSINLPNGRYDG